MPDRAVFSAAVIQRAQTQGATHASGADDYPALLKLHAGAGSTERLNVVIFTCSLDSDHAKLFKSGKKAYAGRSCNVLNSTEILYDAGTGGLPAIATALSGSISRALDEGKKCILVLASHGNVQWLFGAAPGSEKVASKQFAAAVKAWALSIDERLSVSKLFSLIVLDACWSATELAQPVNPEAPNLCPTRLLSSHWSSIPIFGFNGRAAEGKVNYYSAAVSTQKTSQGYGKNVVIFKNGAPVKSSSPHQTLYHDTSYMLGEAFYRDTLFQGRLPAFFASTSF